MRIEFVKNTTDEGKSFQKGQQLGVTLARGRELIAKGVAIEIGSVERQVADLREQETPKPKKKTKKIEENGD